MEFFAKYRIRLWISLVALTVIAAGVGVDFYQSEALPQAFSATRNSIPLMIVPFWVAALFVSIFLIASILFICQERKFSKPHRKAKRPSSSGNRPESGKSRFKAVFQHEIQHFERIIKQLRALSGRIVRHSKDDHVKNDAKALEEGCRKLKSIYHSLINEAPRRESIASSEVDTFDLYDLLHDCAESLELTANAENVLFKIDYDRLSPRQYSGALNCYQTIIARLMTYAVRHAEPGAINIEVREIKQLDTASLLRLKIKYRKRWHTLEKEQGLSGYFDQEDYETLDDFAICRQLAEAAGNKLTKNDGLFKEASLIFEFKLTSVVNWRKEQVATIISGSEDKRLLLVEDNDVCRDILANLLTSWGFKVEAARSAEVAKTLLRENPDFQYGIFDLTLPGASGEDLAAYCRSEKSFADMTIISLTGIGCKPSRDLFDETLLKPITPDALRGAIASIVARQTNTAANYEEAIS